jgi:hypothetical protein
MMYEGSVIYNRFSTENVSLFKTKQKMTLRRNYKREPLQIYTVYCTHTINLKRPTQR